MTHSQVKIILVDPSLPEDQAELNVWIGRGWELLHVSAIRDTALVTLGLPSKAGEYLHGVSNSVPSQKQYGYIRWAFDVQPEDLAEHALKKNEASKIISAHKEVFGDNQANKGDLQAMVEQMRKDRQEPTDSPPADDDFDEDKPF